MAMPDAFCHYEHSRDIMSTLALDCSEVYAGKKLHAVVDGRVSITARGSRFVHFTYLQCMIKFI